MSQPSAAVDQLLAEDVEHGEEWVRQLQEEQHERFIVQAQMLHKEHLAELDTAGPFVTTEMRVGLEQKYDERLDQMRQMHQEELDQRIEMERQKRLWSLRQQDPGWEGWDRVFREQMGILAKIKGDVQRSREIGITVDAGRSEEETIRENEREEEDLKRPNEERQRTEYQRVQDQERLTDRHGEERRQRDKKQSTEVEVEVGHSATRPPSRTTHTASNTEDKVDGLPVLTSSAKGEALPHPAIWIPPERTHEQSRPVPPPQSSVPSQPTKGSRMPQSQAPRVTVTDSAQASTSQPQPRPPVTYSSHPRESAAYSAQPPPARHSSTQPPVSTSPSSENRGKQEDIGRAFAAPRPATASKTNAGSNTVPAPTNTGSKSVASATKAGSIPSPAQEGAGNEPPGFKLWIPPGGTREPTRKGPPDGVKESSILFGGSPASSPSPMLPEERARMPQGQASSQQQSYREPNASAPGPRPRDQAQQQQARHVPPPPPFQPPNAPPPSASYSQASPTTSYSAAPSSHDPLRRQKDAGHASAAPRPAAASNTDGDQKTVQSSVKAGLKPAPSTNKAGPAPSSTRAGAKPTHPLLKPALWLPSKSSDEWKSKERADEEQKLRENAENEKRAEEARKRGAEKRKAEAREAERSEADRKGRGAGKPSHIPTRPERPILEVWTAYENQWGAMAQASQLRFRSIPWPVSAPVSTSDMLLPIQIASFVLSPQHSPGKARKDRLRDALLRWHPDRFESKWLKKVVEEEREAVKEGVRCVVSALNDLLSTEGTFAA